MLLSIPDYQTYIRHLGYLGIYIWFISFDQITPLPEEISLLVLGYLVSQHIFNPVLAGATSIAGFLTIDIIYYQLSRTGSSLIKNRKKKTRSYFVHIYREKLKNNLAKTLLILAFIPRMRLFAPILVGGMKVPFRKFLFYDTLSLILFTGVYVTLGAVFNHSISSLIGKTNSVQDFIFFGALIIVGGVLLLMVKKREHVEEESK